MLFIASLRDDRCDHSVAPSDGVEWTDSTPTLAATHTHLVADCRNQLTPQAVRLSCNPLFSSVSFDSYFFTIKKQRGTDTIGKK